MPYSVLEMFPVVNLNTCFAVLLVIIFDLGIIDALQPRNSVGNKEEYSISAEKGSDISIPCDAAVNSSHTQSWYKVKHIPINRYHKNTQ